MQRWHENAFPFIETPRVLPTYSELVRDLTSYDLVGFHTPSDLGSFYSAVGHVFGTDKIAKDLITVGSHKLRCGVFPPRSMLQNSS